MSSWNNTVVRLIAIFVIACAWSSVALASDEHVKHGFSDHISLGVVPVPYIVSALNNGGRMYVGTAFDPEIRYSHDIHDSDWSFFISAQYAGLANINSGLGSVNIDQQAKPVSKVEVAAMLGFSLTITNDKSHRESRIAVPLLSKFTIAAVVGNFPVYQSPLEHVLGAGVVITLEIPQPLVVNF